MIDGSIQASIFLYYEYYVPYNLFRDIEEVVKYVLRLYTTPYRNLSKLEAWHKRKFGENLSLRLGIKENLEKTKNE